MPLEGSFKTDDGARPGNTAAGGLHLLPRLLSRRRQCCTYVFQMMWHPLAKCHVWDASKDVKLVLSKSEKNHLEVSVAFRTWGSAIASVCSGSRLERTPCSFLLVT